MRHPRRHDDQRLPERPSPRSRPGPVVPRCLALKHRAALAVEERPCQHEIARRIADGCNSRNRAPQLSRRPRPAFADRHVSMHPDRPVPRNAATTAPSRGRPLAIDPVPKLCDALPRLIAAHRPRCRRHDEETLHAPSGGPPAASIACNAPKNPTTSTRQLHAVTHASPRHHLTRQPTVHRPRPRIPLSRLHPVRPAPGSARQMGRKNRQPPRLLLRLRDIAPALGSRTFMSSPSRKPPVVPAVHRNRGHRQTGPLRKLRRDQPLDQLHRNVELAVLKFLLADARHDISDPGGWLLPLAAYYNMRR